MYLVLDDGICDCDVPFCQNLFDLLDARFDILEQRMKESFHEGLCDSGEYLAGLGFVLCQRYLASTYGQDDVAKSAALAIGPCHEGGETFARIINAAANYWKHLEEWDTNAIISRNTEELKKQSQKDTIRIIETVTPWADYTCSNLLAELTDPNPTRLAALIPILEAWRNQLVAAYAG